MMSPTMHFEIEATANAQTLSRLINFFAQRDLTPSLVRATHEGSSISVIIEQPDLELAHAIIIAEKMRASVLVEWVVLRPLPENAELGPS